MSQTEQVSLHLHRKALDHVRHRIAEGAFSSADEFVETLILGDMDPRQPTEDEVLAWIETEGLHRLQRLHANPSSALTADQAFAGLVGDPGGPDRA